MPGGRGTFRQWWSTLLAMTGKELTMMLRYPVEFVASFGQIFLMIAVFTLATLMFARHGASPEGGTDGTLISGVMVYGFILFLFLTETLWNIGYKLRSEQKQGTFEQLYLSPASRSASLMSRVLVTLLWTGVMSLAATWMMQALVGRLPFANPSLALLILLLALSGTFGTGFAFAAVTLRLREGAQPLAGFLQFAFMLVCAPFYSFATLPGPVRLLARVIPLAYGVDCFRSTLMGFPPGFPELAPLNTELMVVAAFGLAMPGLGLWLYHREEERARRQGTLAEI
jgi:ABC-type polysaccharide/polyol phosphate export permease